MNRRELLKLIAVATGGVVIGGEFLLSGCKNTESNTPLVFTEDNIAFLDEVAETILPQTSTAGHTPRRPRQPDIVQIIHAGTSMEKNGN